MNTSLKNVDVARDKYRGSDDAIEDKDFDKSEFERDGNGVSCCGVSYLWKAAFKNFELIWSA